MKGTGLQDVFPLCYVNTERGPVKSALAHSAHHQAKLKFKFI